MTTQQLTSDGFPPSTVRRAAMVPRSGLAAVAALRTEPELTACETEAGVWLALVGAKSAADESLLQRLRLATAAEWFEVTADQELIPPGRQVPVGMLPAGPWRPLQELLAVAWPRAGLAAGRPNACRLHLVRSEREAPTTYLEIPLADCARLAADTPEIRLNRWECAASAAGTALFRGSPLPTVDGTRFYERDSILIPAGYCWEPDVSPQIVRRLFHMTAEEIVLWRADPETWERIPGDAFLPARRANLRQTVIEWEAASKGQS
jgi:hypothetical protein